MYDVQFKGKKVEKDFKKLLHGYTKKVKDKIKYTLYHKPYPSPTHGDSLCKVERKGRLYGIEVTGGDRILYDIISLEGNLKIILIHLAGNHDEEIKYLKKHAK